MKRISILIVMLIGLCFANVIAIKQVFSPGDLRFGKVGEFDRIAMPLSVCPFEPGEPALPARPVYVFLSLMTKNSVQ
jgi:hypothetical protein